MTDLSPAAQAVLEGFRAVPTLMDGPSIAGALRAAAEALASPEQADPDSQWDLGFVAACAVIYGDLNAIAAELEAQ